MLCMHDGILDAIDMLEMLCTLNLTQFTPILEHIGSERNINISTIEAMAEHVQ